MSVTAIVGAQWGDEGKAKLVDLLASEGATVAQWAGGYSAGQSLMAGGERLVFHVLPSAGLSAGRPCLLAQGMALDPRLLLEELDHLESHGAYRGELWVCQRAKVVLPHHVELDRLRAEGEGASGAPRRGLGPAYADTVARRGVRIGDLLDKRELEARIAASIEHAAPLLEALGAEVPEVGPIASTYAACGERLARYVVDGSRKLHALRREGMDILLEGPFGTMVDIDQGYYPFVVGASTVAGGACTGTGLAPRDIDRVLGVAKAYTTRAGSGPLPSELDGDVAAHLRRAGGELSPTTARPRRCGMLDLPALRYAARINGFDGLALTKLDVLSGLEEVPVCVDYELDGAVEDEPPFEGSARVRARVETLAGWQESLSDCRRYDDLPEAARAYVRFVEEAVGVTIEWVGVGPDRAQTLRRG